MASASSFSRCIYLAKQCRSWTISHHVHGHGLWIQRPDQGLVSPLIASLRLLSTSTRTALSTPPPSLFGRTLVCSRVHAVTTAPVIRIQSRTYAGQKDAPLVDLDAIRNDENWTDDNGLTMKQREKIENWVLSFTKDSIPKGLLTLNFVRSSGPGGQNVNKVNTKVDMRFVIDEAFWLPEYVRTRLTIMESNKVNKNGEFVLSSDRKRTQMANLDDCLEKLHETLLKAAELCSLPDQETLEKLERIKRAGNQRRKQTKQLQSQKKASRRIGRDD